MNNWKLSAALAAVFLTACGGGGSSGGISSDGISGKLVDGYINGATVFWDCNANNIVDNGELSTTTGAGGVYTLAQKPSDSCRLTALIPPTAIDEDTGTSVLSSYTMYGLSSNPKIINPFTTLVTVNDDSASEFIKVANLKAALSISADLDTDYVGTDNQELRKFGKVTARILQSNHSTSGYAPSAYTNATNVLTQSASLIRSSSLADVIGNKITLPSDSFGGAFNGFLLDTSIGVQINHPVVTAAQFDYLTEMLATSHVKSAIGNGQVNWDRLPIDQLDKIYAKLKSVNLLSPNDSEINAWYATKSELLRIKFKDSLNSSNQIISLEWASLWPLLDIGADTIKGVYGAAKMTPIGGKAAWAARKGVSYIAGGLVPIASANTKKVIKTLNKLKRVPSLMQSCGDPINALGAIFTEENLSLLDEANTTVILDSSVGLIGCFGDLFDSGGIQFAISAMAVNSSEDPLDVFISSLEMIQVFADAVPPNSVSDTISGFTDFASAAADSYKQGLKLKELADKKFNLATAELQTKLDNQINLTRTVAYKRLIREALEERIVRADINLKAPSISSLTTSPTTVIHNQLTTFSVNGHNLPLDSNLDISFNGCSNIVVTARSATTHQFTCTPTAAAGATITAVFRSVANGYPISGKGFDVAVAAPTSKYSLVTSNGITYSKTECVKDTSTGFVWEGKEASGVRSGENSYTNYDSLYGTPAEIYADSNTYGYINYINTIRLCGSANWRLPTRAELQTLVLPVTTPSVTTPSIDLDWFPNTYASYYWTLDSYSGDNSRAWTVRFTSGSVYWRSKYYAPDSRVRLIQSSN